MEAAAYTNEEPHSDHSPSVDPVLGALARTVNDVLNDAERKAALVPLIVPLINTSGDPDLTTRRAYLIRDLSVRQIFPTLFDFVGLTDVSAALREVAPVVDEATAAAARIVLMNAWGAAAVSGLPWSTGGLLRSVAENLKSAVDSAASAAEGEIADRLASRIFPVPEQTDAVYLTRRAVMVDLIVSSFAQAIALK